jgi:MFS family permease
MGCEAAPTKATWCVVLFICAAQFLFWVGANFWPALLPSLMALWALSYSEAGCITAVYYLAYLVSVPVLLTATDRIDAKTVYLFGTVATVASYLFFALVVEGFWGALTARVLAGVGEAGTFMVGLKLLADRINKKQLSRAVACHAACISISAAMSFICVDLLTGFVGWRGAFLLAGLSSGCAGLIILLFVVRRETSQNTFKNGRRLFDFRPVFRNRSAMAYALTYSVHTLESVALRGWVVAFLVFVGSNSDGHAASLSPTFVAAVLILLGSVANIIGNELAMRCGRRRLISLALVASAIFGSSIGFVGPLSYALAVGLVLGYGISAYLDSSSLTAGTAGTAELPRQGATLAIHSMLGYAGGFIGPLIVGLVLDRAGGMSQTSWGLAFLLIAVLNLIALALFWIIKPRELEGDRTKR